MNAHAAAQVWRLVSGLPSGKRESRRIMVLQPQAFIDDSVRQPNQAYFVLAGFVSSANNWAHFSDDWQAALDLEPKLDYFKMNEANLLIEQFDKKRGWTEAKRDDRVITLTRIIKKYALIRCHSSIKVADFEKHIASISVPQRKLVSDSPYIYLFTKLICAMAVRSTVFGINEPCKFVFDQQKGFSEEIFAYWPVFKKIVEDQSRSDFPTFIGGRPDFEDDKEFKPLQAADLYANQMRFHLENNMGKIIVPPTVPLRQLSTIANIPHDTIEDDLAEFRASALKFKEQFIKENPDTILVGYATTSKERRLIRKRGRRRAKKPSASSSKKSRL